MAFQFHLWPDLKLGVIRYAGKFEHENQARASDAVLNHPAFREDMKLILDHTESDMRHLDFETMRTHVYRMEPRYAQRRGYGRFAVVAPDELTYGFARMFQALTATKLDEVHVVQNVPSALTALDVDIGDPTVTDVMVFCRTRTVSIP